MPSLTPTVSACGGHWTAPKTRARRAVAVMLLDHAIDNSRSSTEHRPAKPLSRVPAFVLGCARPDAPTGRGAPLTLRFRRDVSMHLAKGTEKTAAAPITDRPSDLLN